MHNADTVPTNAFALASQCANTVCAVVSGTSFLSSPASPGAALDRFQNVVKAVYPLFKEHTAQDVSLPQEVLLHCGQSLLSEKFVTSMFHQAIANVLERWCTTPEWKGLHTRVCQAAPINPPVNRPVEFLFPNAVALVMQGWAVSSDRFSAYSNLFENDVLYETRQKLAPVFAKASVWDSLPSAVAIEFVQVLKDNLARLQQSLDVEDRVVAIAAEETPAPTPAIRTAKMG